MRKSTLVLIFCALVSLNLHARGTSQAIVVNPYFSLGYVNPADINDKITMDPGGVQTFVTDAGTIRWGKSLGAFLGYRFSHRFNVGFVLDRVSYGTLASLEDTTSFKVWHPSSRTQINAKFYEFNSGASAFSFGPAFYYTIYSGGRLTFDTGLGVLYAKTKYYEDASYSATSSSSGVKTSSLAGSGSAFGFMINTSTTYYFTNYLGVAFDLGFRYLKCNSLTDDTTGEEMKFRFNNGTYDPSNMTIDFSGLYFGLGIKIDFNISGSKDAAKPEEQNWNENPAKEANPQELNTTWGESAPLPLEEGPSVEEIRVIKKQVQRKYNEAKTSGAPDAQAKTERYQKLYDIVNRLERDWDQFSPKSRKDKVEKIKLILSR